MSRQIFAEEEKDNKQQNTIQTDNAEGIMHSNIPNDEETIISANEIEKLFHEWDANGHNDLIINKALAKRIRQYLDYQKELDPLKEELAKRIYKPFICRGTCGEVRTLFVDGSFVGTIKVYEFYGRYRIMDTGDFKKMLIALKNPYAIWIPESKTFSLKKMLRALKKWIPESIIGVDFEAYLINIGRRFEIDDSRIEVIE